MTVDFAYKQFDRGNRGYALRSVKLGISRKLMFASGLLACFWCDPEISKMKGQGTKSSEFDCLLGRLLIADTASERLALFFTRHLDNEQAEFLRETALILFGAYDEFLGLLNKPEKRKRLESLQPEEVHSDDVFKAAKSIRTRFRDAIQSMFLDNRSPLYALTIDKGVF